MGKYCAIVFAILVCMALVAPHAESAACDAVYNKLSPCRNVLKQGGAVPANCCDSIRSLNGGSTTTAARQSVCECVKKLANDYKVNGQTAAGVLKKCNINVEVPSNINNIDCKRVN